MINIKLVYTVIYKINVHHGENIRVCVNIIKGLITVPGSAPFSMPSFTCAFLIVIHTCTFRLAVWLKRGHKSSSRE